MAIKGFGIDDIRLMGKLVVDRVSEGAVFVEDGNFSLSILTDGHLSVAQGVIRTVRLDLVDDLIGLHGQVLGEGADFLVGQD